MKFSTDGCAFTIAAAEAASRMAVGKRIRDCLIINQSALLERLGNMPEDHIHCALLAAMTFQRALRDHREKKKRG